MPKTFPTPRRAPVSKSLAWQFTVTILLTAGAFWWFRLALPVHAMIHSPELALANGGIFYAVFGDILVQTHPVVDFLVALPMAFLTISYVEPQGEPPETLLGGTLWVMTAAFFMAGGAFGLLFTAVQGWGMGLIVFLCTGLVFAAFAGFICIGALFILRPRTK